MVTIFILTVIAAVAVALAALRGRVPDPVERELILNPTKRRLCRGLYMPRDLFTFIEPNTDGVLAYARRYGGSPFSLDIVGWAFGLASIFVVSAIYLGWAMFDITTLGAWSFFPKDVGVGMRWLQALMAIVPLCLLVSFAADAGTLSHRFQVGSESQFVGVYRFCVVVVIWGNIGLFGNSGLLFMAAGALLLISKDRGFMILVFLPLIAALILGFVPSLSVTQSAIALFMLLVAAMAWVAFNGTVAILAALKWYQSETPVMLLGLLAIAVLGGVCAYVTPFLMVFVLYGVMVLAPESIHTDWVNMVDVFRTGGTPAAVMLAIACSPPLLPALWFLGRGFGTLIARNLPAMAQFIADLGTCHLGPMGADEFWHLMRPYQRAYAVGYGCAAGFVLVALGAAVWSLGLAFAVTG